MSSSSGPLSPQSTTAPPSSLAVKAANPLSSKVTTVLSSSYADADFREALVLLDERGVSNTAETRRHLRLDLQKEVIDSNGEIIDEFAKVAEQLRRIGTTIGRLNEGFNEMKTQIGSAHKATSSALSEASQLMVQRRQVEQKQALLTAFNANFVLSEDETAALTLTSEPVNDLFFATLTKTKRISKDCEILLGFENQTLGLEIMEQTSKNLNQGFQKLYKWVQREFKTLNLENPQIGSSIRRALRVLAERPSLFQNCLDFFADAREQVLSNSFYTALTGSSPSGMEDPSVKPIELVAHDTLRYVGDMLAWTHSAAVGEREALEGLFIGEGDEIAKGIQAGRDNEIWRLVAEDGEDSNDFDAVKTLNELVDRDMSGAARLLRQRVEQVIQTNEETILAYKLANLLSFYKSTFSRMLSPGSSLVETLGALESEALRQFRSLARDHVAAIQGDFQHTPADLRPPEFLLDALEQLTAIMKTYETSFTSSDDQEEEFEPVLAEAFDPFISGSANMAKSLRAPSNSIFLINCLIIARSSLSRFDFTQRHATRLQTQIEDERAHLVEIQYQFFRHESGLDGLIASLEPLGESKEDVEKVSRLEAVQPPALSQASQMLDDFLPSALMDAVEKLKNLQDSKLAQDTTEEAAERFCVDFEHVEEMLMLADEMAEQEQGESDDFQSLRALFPRTSGEIRVLLSTMFGNRTATAVSTLQKTYDESYLTCSTAVYYESQGNEGEAMRCWRQALEQIYDHSANRVLPNFTPRSETEKALVDSIRQLELQCKERIDLLEALRLSRQETLHDGVSSSENKTTKPLPEPQDVGVPGQQEQGWIGNGTIPAVTYTDLARPDVLRRRSTQSRTPSLQMAAVGENGPQTGEVASPSPSRKPLASTPLQLSPEKKSSRASSPERHTMRTTLRSSRIGEKLTKTTLRRPSQKPVEGPGASKAAILAWGLLGQRDPADQGLADGQELSRPLSNPPTPSEQPRKSMESLFKTWDSNSRRLTTPRTRSPVKQSDRRVSADLADSRQADAHPYPRPSPISVSAASSALNSLALRDSHERRSPVREQITRQRTAPLQTPQTRRRRDLSDVDAGLSEVPKNLPLGRKTSSDSAMVSRRSASKALSANKSKVTRAPSSRSISMTQAGSRRRESQSALGTSPPNSDLSSSSFDTPARSSRRKGNSNRQQEASLIADSLAELSDSSTEDEQTKAAKSWKKRKAAVLKKLPPGVDQHAAKQILNEIIVQGDEVHWTDIAGLEIAKNALRETVVYPFLRPDLFMGLREPARGMLLFGPPGTGKTMLARAVATESKSTFFSISASSLTSKYLGESEKLVRALFALAKVFAPSIIFVDEIDSLLSQRSGTGEHEATRRIKTEFLIQWSDLQRAAAGREVGEKDKERGDANRVLVLAATNLPWAIDEAARRRFVRRQYIPLPEAETRAVQLNTLLKQQKHTLGDADIDTLVGMTDGFSGSDITALAKDAAMGPLRSLGEALLHMTMDEIRPIELSDFVASLTTIRPSVSKTGLKEYEDWAREFGERGG
ncbi:oligomeric complex COG6-domain-containing protein [Chaetomidium leptoderma]|uniref:Conserved oligomeric Golgi complex subunit 6 n=1 Tax=Chaetomidium leptoderma TaxID=669021 RepID=A0AAN7A002_9PEZI|nr:oligomeric complex COG6-domain-containing protein [Chaetomidium leptoderma]